ncbi:MAG: hypothetical protein ABJB47_08845 [Actinomycetota bacterium]
MTGQPGPAEPSPRLPASLPVVPELPRSVTLPGRARLLTWYAGVLVAWLAAGLALLLAGKTGPAGAFPVLLMPLLVGGLLPAIRRWRLRQLLTDGRYQPPGAGTAEDLAGMALATVLEPSGVRDLVLRAGTGHGYARSYRAGHRAVLDLHQAVLARPDVAMFFIAHESGHLARYDTARRPAVFGSAAGIVALLGATWPLAYLALIPLLVLAAPYQRAMELSCDRLATRWLGPAPAEAAMAVLARARAPAGLAGHRADHAAGNAQHPGRRRPASPGRAWAVSAI